MLPMWGNNQGIVTHYCVLRFSTRYTRNPLPHSLSPAERDNGGQAMNSTNSK